MMNFRLFISWIVEGKIHGKITLNSSEKTVALFLVSTPLAKVRDLVVAAVVDLGAAARGPAGTKQVRAVTLVITLGLPLASNHLVCQDPKFCDRSHPQSSNSLMGQMNGLYRSYL